MYHYTARLDGHIGTPELCTRGEGVSQKSDSVGGFEPPPPFSKMVRGGVLRVFFDADTSFVRFFLVVFFWTAHPEFCPCPQFSHF